MDAAVIILTAILSPLVCVIVYFVWKAQREVRLMMRRNEVIEAIKNDFQMQTAITNLITEKIKTDWMFQQAIIALVTDQLQKDWKLEKAVVSITKKAN
jgi:hypothetical protein